ncbi:MAG: ATP-binding protein [Cyclobacteriaceae bacterium]|jgi:nitrogen fixation/metabolism regulation signal transduction histidine kinase|nr:ATP-binding protein [Cyclobacteriaceae bacterium]
MDFRFDPLRFNWKSPHVPRVAMLVVTCVLTGIGWVSSFGFFLNLLLLVAVAFQVYQLIESTDRPPTRLFPAVYFDESLQQFRTREDGDDLRWFVQELNQGVAKAKQSKNEKEADYQFLKNIVQHAGVGLLTFKKDGSVQLINSAAKRLLRVSTLAQIEELRGLSPELVDCFHKLRTGGRELIRIKLGDETVQLSVFVIELTLRAEEVKLISMSNIQTELEEKEMEAWQNLVRVLTHEIMNSVTPISSLAGMVEEDLKHRLAQQQTATLTPEELGDMHLSLSTITKRSEGLIHFVKEFRNLTQIPNPRPVEISVRTLLEELVMLHKKELTDTRIETVIRVEPDTLTVQADKNMIEQVIINLIKNAIQAFDEQPHRVITLRAFVGENKRAVIAIRDNGNGIEPEALEKIFIPFFSTKKSGSGIGLSLSRQIMRQHEGSITVTSHPGLGTEFFLRF